MRLIITAGKAITLVAWIMMGYNLIMPFEGDLSLVLNILLLITLLMHGLQTLVLHHLCKTRLSLTRSDYLNVFVFGVFSLLSYRREVLMSPK